MPRAQISHNWLYGLFSIISGAVFFLIFNKNQIRIEFPKVIINLPMYNGVPQ